MKIEKVETIDDAKVCDKLLTKLVHSEKRYNDNINEKYIVKNWFEKMYKEKNNVIYVAKIENRIIGYIYCKIDSIENGPTINLEAIIDGLYVEENYRHMGIATALMDSVKIWAKDNKVKLLFLNVLDGNKNAMNLYYKNGFEDFERKLKLEL